MNNTNVNVIVNNKHIKNENIKIVLFSLFIFLLFIILLIFSNSYNTYTATQVLNFLTDTLSWDNGW